MPNSLKDFSDHIFFSATTEFLAQFAILFGLLLLYPLRLVIWAYRKRSPSGWLPIAVPTTFDPAPVLYPPVVPLLVSLLLAANTKGVILPNLVLSICGLPKALIPAARSDESYNAVHWILSCIPIFITEHDSSVRASSAAMAPETATLLYPLHETLCLVLHHLTTTSLLPAELQLLAISLVGILFLASSPQAVILKALLWGGGVGILVSCGHIIRWGITLARVPKWRFRRLPPGSKWQSPFRALIRLMPLRKAKYELLGSAVDESVIETGNSSDEQDSHRASLDSNPGVANGRILSGVDGVSGIDINLSSANGDKPDIRFNVADGSQSSPSRRHTVPLIDKSPARAKTHTPSGRKKRSASASVRAFFSLTQTQAAQRRWLYAGYLYISVAAIILIGIREYVGMLALGGEEPIGWALGYLLGDLAGFRLEVVKAGLERWICLPTRFVDDVHAQSCRLGWVEHLRRASFGEANTRLVLSAYWLGILILGLAVVFQLSPIYEVDTRRKVFHFMMVAMFLPATFVDPTYAALALALILAIFLLLDLLRASQLPPLSKPIASFLTPYVDGRDLRGPVVISHIFLLIGCAIPLWLSLAALPRTGSGYLRGWEVPSRDVSMVSGVVCVGLGDAAASLIGRRWGHHKWLWGGGKSLEGSVAFASAVFVGLMAAAFWLRAGGWPVTDEPAPGLWAWDWGRSVRNAGVCASIASLTEAVLTGGNDNVVVPVILWTCVKGLGV